MELFSIRIRRTFQLVSTGLNIFEYNKNSNGAKDYMDLALEVLKLK